MAPSRTTRLLASGLASLAALLASGRARADLGLSKRPAFQCHVSSV
jgi:hypothetical protein